MTKNGQDMHTKILDVAEELILERGYAGTSIDQVIQRADIAKGSFFYHFKSKSDLALALVERYAIKDAEVLSTFMERAERLSRDPLQQVLIFIGLFVEFASDLAAPHPGCLFASYIYESIHFDDQIKNIIRKAMIAWRVRLGEKLREAVKIYPPRIPIDADALADQFTVIVEGAYILAKTFNDASLLSKQLIHFRNYLELLFLDQKYFTAESAEHAKTKK
jgi:TetR/AcrR family transcriptional repressor of nem operon